MATRLQIRTNARSRADQDSSAFPTDTQYNEYIDKGAARVYRRLIALGWTPTLTVVPVTTNGASSYNIGTDVMSIRSVALQQSTTFQVMIPRLTVEEYTALFGQTGQAQGYIVTGGVTTTLAIQLLPRPSSGTYNVTYIPRFPGFTTDVDNWYGPDGSDECIILEAAREGAAKENDSEKVRILETSIARAWDDVIQSADWLHQQHPGTVRDTTKVQRVTDGFDFQAVEGWV